MLITFFAALIASALITFLLTPLARLIALRFGLVDDPRIRPHPAHTHIGIIPRAGGLALGIGIIISIALFLPMTKLIWGLVIGTLLLVVVGVMDDKRDVSPYLRLGVNLLAALLVVGAGAGIPYITHPFGA